MSPDTPQPDAPAPFPHRIGTLRLPRPVYQQLRAHAEEAYPAECCGALLGRRAANGEYGGWIVEAALRAANADAAAPHNRYEIAPAELVRIARQARARGLEIAGFYHSHPDRPAQWSPTDFAEAHWLGCCYVITEVAHGNAAGINSFFLAGSREEDKWFAPQAIVVVE